MNEPLIMMKWIALAVTLSIVIIKCFWAIYAVRKRNLIISIRVISFYPSRRIEGTSSFGKKQFMSASNWWSVAYWVSISLCAILWLVDLVISTR